MKKKNDDAKKEMGADFGALEEAEAKLLGRDRFMVDKPSEKEEIKVVKNEEPVSVSEQKESASNTSAQSEVSGKDESHNLSQESDQKQEESSTSNTSEKASESNNTNELSQPNDSNSVANQESNVSTNESSNNNNNEISASQ